MKKTFPISVFFVTSLLSFGQTSNFEVTYDGLSSQLPSPHIINSNGNIGIKNPERGFSINGGLFDMYSKTDFPSKSYSSNLNDANSEFVTPLSTYIENYKEDGISLVELEAYVHYEDNLSNSAANFNTQDINKAGEEITALFKDLGLKSHFILNSSLVYNKNSNDGITNKLDVDGSRFKKNLDYFDKISPLFKTLNPYIAVAHLGWVNSPWDFNQYRLSSNWKKSNYSIGQNYPIGNEIQHEALKNYHGESRESTQRSSWGQPHSEASAWAYQSDLNILRKQILDKALDVFEDKKILLKSSYAISNYIGTSLNSTGPAYIVTYPVNYMDLMMSGKYFKHQVEIPQLISKLHDDKNNLRLGIYDHAFGGDTYSHLWTIGNGNTQMIQWSAEYPSNIGVDWANNPYYTDVLNLRKYRGNLWMHGEMPVYETEDPLDNKLQNNSAWSTSSFNRHHQYFSNWYEGSDQKPNHQYDYEIAEGMSSGRLQDGFYSALKLRYFNFTSFNIQHNNLLDGRSPYEMPEGYDYSTDSTMENLVGDGIPKTENTAISGWKSKMINPTALESFGMPISKNYFKGEFGELLERSAYDYIRDHLGYRLELQSTSFQQSSGSLKLKTSIINRGFAAPQNKRRIYFVILNSENKLVRFTTVNNDWRDWQPDAFSNGLDNTSNLQVPVTNSSYGSLDNIVEGGIPIGNHRSNWHHDPITTYEPNIYTLTPEFNLYGLEEGSYKVGIFMPDNHPELENDPEFAVKFANQTTYIPCLGVTVLGSFSMGNTLQNDKDCDGILDQDDDFPLRPSFSDYQQFVLENGSQCSGILTSIDADKTLGNPTEFITTFPNPAKNTITVQCIIPWNTGKIVGVNGDVVSTFINNGQSLDISTLSPGLYFIHIIADEKLVIQRFVKQ